jgi:autotransporter family porin
MVPVVAHQVALAELGTFHMRQGDQSYLTDRGPLTGLWARYHRAHIAQTGDQTVEGTDFQIAPKFDGNLWLAQAGIDVIADVRDDGSQLRATLFYSHAESSGDVNGNVLARFDMAAGTLKTNSDGVGASLTYVGTNGWYLDFVGLYSWLDADTRSYRGFPAKFKGKSLAASLEAGYPIALSDHWKLEPQAQLIAQQVKIDPSGDLYSNIDFDSFETITGRPGVRMEGNLTYKTTIFQPFLTADVWHDFGRKNDIIFNERAIISDSEASILRLGGGLAARLTPSLGVHVRLDWSTNIGGEHYRSRGANIGMRFTW